MVNNLKNLSDIHLFKNIPIFLKPSEWFHGHSVVFSDNEIVKKQRKKYIIKYHAKLYEYKFVFNNTYYDDKLKQSSIDYFLINNKRENKDNKSATYLKVCFLFIKYLLDNIFNYYHYDNIEHIDCHNPFNKFHNPTIRKDIVRYYFSPYFYRNDIDYKIVRNQQVCAIYGVEAPKKEIILNSLTLKGLVN